MTEYIKQRIAQIQVGEVPQGYKKSKFGILPSMWEIKKLGDLGIFKKGKEVATSNTIQSGLPAMMYGDIYVKYDTKFSSVDYRISEETANKSTPVYKGDLLFTCSGETAKEIGKCVCYTGDDKIYIGGDILALSPSNANSLFLAYQQNSYQQIKQKAKFGQGHSVVHIYLNSISALKCFIPPLHEQEKIAEILTICDKVIELKERLIAEKQRQKKWLMQNLLTGKKRLQGFIGKLEKVKLGEITIYQEGPGVRNTQYTRNGIKLLNVGNFKNNKIVLDATDKYISNEVACGAYKHFLVDENDLLIACSGIKADYFCEKVAFAKKEHLPLCMNTSTMRFKSKDVNKLDIVYLYCFLQSDYFVSQIKGILTGSAQFNFGPTHLKYLNILIPSLSEQIAIANILSTAEQEIDFLQKDLEQWEQKKKALMQLLLTGKVRV